MLTLSTERFVKIQKEVPADYQHHLVQVTKYQAAQNCKVGSCTCEFLLLMMIPGKQRMRAGVAADMDRWEVAVAEGAAVGTARHTLPPVRGASGHRLQAGLHLWESGRHEASQGCPGTWILRGMICYCKLKL